MYDEERYEFSIYTGDVDRVKAAIRNHKHQTKLMKESYDIISELMSMLINVCSGDLSQGELYEWLYC